MKTRVLLLLTSDSEFEAIALVSANSAGYDLLIGRNPEDGARLFARNLDGIEAVVVDLDICEHGSAWLGALNLLSRKLPALAVSGLQQRFLQPLAQRHGAEHWLSKPISSERLTAVLKALCLPAPKTEAGQI